MHRQDLIDMLSGTRRGAGAATVRALAAAVEPFYAAAVTWRNRSFDAGRRASKPLDRPAVSVGNLTTGGAGKTPMVIELCRRLADHGRRPGVLLRGYGGDETRELAEALGDLASVEANPDRAAGAAALLQRDPATAVFVLDDGFQHRQVQRDLDLVLIDATNPWGFGHVLPRGLLREPLDGLRRADAVIVTRADAVDAMTLRQLDETIEQHHGQRPAAHAAMCWLALCEGDDQAVRVEALRGMSVVAVAGIGNPQAFVDMLERHGAKIAATARFDDHHAYRPDDVRRVAATLERHAAAAVVMTEKDWVKWRQVQYEMGSAASLRVLRPKLGLRWLDGADHVDALLRAVGKK